MDRVGNRRTQRQAVVQGSKCTAICALPLLRCASATVPARTGARPPSHARARGERLDELPLAAWPPVDGRPPWKSRAAVQRNGSVLRCGGHRPNLVRRRGCAPLMRLVDGLRGISRKRMRPCVISSLLVSLERTYRIPGGSWCGLPTRRKPEGYGKLPVVRDYFSWDGICHWGYSGRLAQTAVEVQNGYSKGHNASQDIDNSLTLS